MLALVVTWLTAKNAARTFLIAELGGRIHTRNLIAASGMQLALAYTCVIQFGKISLPVLLPIQEGVNLQAHIKLMESECILLVNNH
jgi:hypothetical protein